MTDEASKELRPDLLDDFYSECDEHLSAIRQSLGALEEDYAGGKSLRESEVRTLQNRFHSFKGISALAGVASAEQLAHAAEDYLRPLLRQNQAISARGLNALMEATKRLEQTLNAHREKQPLPDVRQAVENLAALAPSEENATPAAPQTLVSAPQKASELPALIEEARQSGWLVWRCIFTPRKDLDERGININSVRDRLNRLGRILESAPKIEAGKGIAFHFVLALREPPEELAEWEADAIRFEPLSESVETAEPSPASAPLHSPFIAPSKLVRVDIGKLDELMRVMENLVIQRARLEDQLARLARQSGERLVEPLREISRQVERSLRSLREAIMDIRLVPVAHIFERMPFAVRDLASDSGKRVRVQLSGQETEIDKYIIDQLQAPLLHVVRNSISHGIENAEERQKTGKPAEGTISLSAKTAGDSVIISIKDDGRGIDVKQVVKQAAAAGATASETMTSAELLSLLCRPGFSTRPSADRAAGRGVGMAIAYEALHRLGGSMTLDTELGKGTVFTFRLPLTLAIANVFVVSSSDLLYAVPQASIAEVLELETKTLRRIGQNEAIHYRNGLLPLVRLGEFFQRPTSETRQNVLVLEADNGLVGVVVDRVTGQREVVVKALKEPFARAKGIAGATELGDGRPVLILDISALTRGAARPMKAEHSSLLTTGSSQNP